MICWGQNSYFNKAYDIDGFSMDNLGAVVSTPDSGYMVVSDLDSQGDHGFFNMKLDKNGDTLWLKKFLGFQSNFGITNFADYRWGDTTYYFTGSTIVNNLQVPFLIQFDRYGDTLKLIIESDFGHEAIGRVAAVHPDGGIMLFGDYLSDTVNYFVSYFATKYDSNLNKIWTKKWPMVGDNYIYSARILSDTSYIICGARYNGYGFIMRTDELGEILWQRTFPGYWTMNTFEIQGSLVSNASSSVGSSYYCHLIHHDINNGNILSVDTLNKSLSGTPGAFHIEDKGDHLLLGGVYLSSGIKAWTAAVSFEGNVLWERLYTYHQADQFHQIKTAIPTLDGGILIGGSTGATGFSQDIWIVKVDSVGCLTPNCNIGLEEPIRKNEIKLYPNPTSSIINIELTQHLLEGEIEIYTIMGHLTRSYSVEGMETKLNIPDLKSGSYILIIKEKGAVVGREIVVKE